MWKNQLVYPFHTWTSAQWPQLEQPEQQSTAAPSFSPKYKTNIHSPYWYKYINVEERQASHTIEFQIIHEATLPWGQRIIPTPWVWAAHSDFPPKRTRRKAGRKEQLHSRDTATTPVSWLRSTVTSHIHGVPCTVREDGTWSLCSSSQNTQPQSSHEKISDESHWGRNYLPRTAPDCCSPQTQENLRNPCDHRKPTGRTIGITMLQR